LVNPFCPSALNAVTSPTPVLSTPSPQVLFCRLTPEQHDLYRAYLASKEVDAILAGDRNALAGIDVLRKICNHPDLLQRATWQGLDDYGNPKRSGKMLVVEKARACFGCFRWPRPAVLAGRPTRDCARGPMFSEVWGMDGWQTLFASNV
jgi:hypothetical protein